jgi:hypothetical protein
MLLRIQNISRDILCVMLLNIIPKHEGNCLAFFDADLGYQAFTVNTVMFLFSECYERAACLVFSFLDCDVKLELSVFAAEGSDFAGCVGC